MCEEKQTNVRQNNKGHVNCGRMVYWDHLVANILIRVDTRRYRYKYRACRWKFLTMLFIYFHSFLNAEGQHPKRVFLHPVRFPMVLRKCHLYLWEMPLNWRVVITDTANQRSCVATNRDLTLHVNSEFSHVTDRINRKYRNVIHVKSWGNHGCSDRRLHRLPWERQTHCWFNSQTPLSPRCQFGNTLPPSELRLFHYIGKTHTIEVINMQYSLRLNLSRRTDCTQKKLYENIHCV